MSHLLSTERGMISAIHDALRLLGKRLPARATPRERAELLATTLVSAAASACASIGLNFTCEVIEGVAELDFFVEQGTPARSKRGARDSAIRIGQIAAMIDEADEDADLCAYASQLRAVARGMIS